MTGLNIGRAKGDFTYAIKGAALAAGLAVMSFAGQASASTELKLTHAEMDGTYRVNLLGHGEVLSNGINFAVTETISGDQYDLFAFCVDIFHNISLGDLNLTYISNKGDPGEPLTTNFGNATPLTLDQKARVSALVDIGFLMHRDSPGAATSLQTAAIQAAIWETLNPGKVSLRIDNLGGGQATDYTTAYNFYLTNDFGPVDRIFTIVPTNGATQAFAVGWPVEGVPEPATWGLMLIGFFSVGGMLRRRDARALTH